jgi:AraC family transcriptional regulator
MVGEPSLFTGANRCEQVSPFHRWATERVILTMRKQFSEELTLGELAHSSGLSPSHLDRVFRIVTGITPFQFLRAIRIQAAQQLLLTTQLSITEVCFEVGYNSLGTFTRQFTRLVGTQPNRLRTMVHRDGFLEEARNNLESFRIRNIRQPAYIHGNVIGQRGSSGLIFIGVFPGPIPENSPIACCFLTEPSPYVLAPVQEGANYVLAARVPWSEDPWEYLKDDIASWVGIGRVPFGPNSSSDRICDIVLRPKSVFDPPIVVALPVLLSRLLRGV